MKINCHDDFAVRRLNLRNDEYSGQNALFLGNSRKSWFSWFSHLAVQRYKLFILGSFLIDRRGWRWRGEHKWSLNLCLTIQAESNQWNQELVMLEILTPNSEMRDMASAAAANNATEPLETIEWDLPVDGGEMGYIDFSKLSMGTEMRNKLWENDNQNILNSYNSSSTTMSSSTSPLLDQNSTDSTQSDSSSYCSTNLKSPNGNSSVSFNGGASGVNLNKFSQQNSSAIPAQPHNDISSQPPSRVPAHQPLLQSPIPMPNISSERKTPELLCGDESSAAMFDNRRVSWYILYLHYP